MRGKGWAVGAAVATALGAAAALAELRRRAPGGPGPHHPAHPENPPPSPEVDPFGALDAARERLRRRAADLGAEGGDAPPAA